MGRLRTNLKIVFELISKLDDRLIYTTDPIEELKFRRERQRLKEYANELTADLLEVKKLLREEIKEVDKF